MVEGKRRCRALWSTMRTPGKNLLRYYSVVPLSVVCFMAAKGPKSSFLGQQKPSKSLRQVAESAGVRYSRFRVDTDEDDQDDRADQEGHVVKDADSTEDEDVDLLGELDMCEERGGEGNSDRGRHVSTCLARGISQSRQRLPQKAKRRGGGSDMVIDDDDDDDDNANDESDADDSDNGNEGNGRGSGKDQEGPHMIDVDDGDDVVVVERERSSESEEIQMLKVQVRRLQASVDRLSWVNVHRSRTELLERKMDEFMRVERSLPQVQPQQLPLYEQWQHQVQSIQQRYVAQVEKLYESWFLEQASEVGMRRKPPVPSWRPLGTSSVPTTTTPHYVPRALAATAATSATSATAALPVTPTPIVVPFGAPSFPLAPAGVPMGAPRNVVVVGGTGGTGGLPASTQLLPPTSMPLATSASELVSASALRSTLAPSQNLYKSGQGLNFTLPSGKRRRVSPPSSF